MTTAEMQGRESRGDRDDARGHRAVSGHAVAPGRTADRAGQQRMLMALQRSAGNAAISAMLAGNRGHPGAGRRAPGPAPRTAPAPAPVPAAQVSDARGGPGVAAPEPDLPAATENSVQQAGFDGDHGGAPPADPGTPNSDGSPSDASSAVQRRSTDLLPVVQRDVVGDIAGAVLPGWVTELVVQVPNTARTLAGTLTGRTQTTEQQTAAQGDAVGGTAQVGTDQAAGAGTRDMTVENAKAAQTATAGETQAAAHQQAAASSSAALSAAGPRAVPLLNPVLPMVQGGRAEGGGTAIGGLPAAIPGGMSEFGSDVSKAVKEGVGADGNEGWDCDQSEVMAIAGGVGRAVTRAAVKAGKAVLGEERYAQLESFVQGKIAGLKRTVAGIKAGATKVVAKITKFWSDKVDPLLKKVTKALDDAKKLFEKVKTSVKKTIDGIIDKASKGWERVEKTFIKPFLTWAQEKKQWIEGAVNSAKSRLGSWWTKLPAPLKRGLEGAALIVIGPIGLAVAAAAKAAQLLVAKKDKIIEWIRKKADAAVSSFGNLYQRARGVLDKVVAKVRVWGRTALDKAKAAGRAIAGAIDANTPAWVKKLQAAAASLKQRISGKVCTTLGDVAGPCVDQFVPDLGANAPKGASHDVTVAATGSLAAVVEGVPVKVAGGGSLALSRQGHKYKVVLSGDGSVAVTTPAKAAENSASVTLPASLGGGKAAWTAITGQGGAPAGAPGQTTGGGGAPGGTTSAGGAPGGTTGGGTGGPGQTTGGDGTPGGTTGGGTAGPGQTTGGGGAPGGTTTGGGAPGGGGSSQEVSAEAGYKAKVEMSYEFDGTKPGADTTCDGVGGMVAMLAAVGASRALPPPFNAMVGEGNFAQNLTGCTVTLSQFGNAKVDLKKDGVGGLQAAISGEAGVSVGRERTENGFVDTATIFGSIGGSLGGELLLRAKPELKVGATVGMTGRLQVSLSYNEEQDKISAMSAGGSVTVSLGSISVPRAQDILPEPIASAVAAALAPYRRFTEGTLEAQASLSFENLHELLGRLDTYVNTNGGGSTSQGIIDIVTQHFATEGNVTTSITVVLKITRVLAAAELSAGGDGVAVSAGISVTENQTVPLYPVAAPGPGGTAPQPSIQARKWGCTDVRCNVYPVDKDAKCPDRVVGNADYVYGSFDEACKAAQSDANSKVPRGCNKRHCNCNSKCTQK